MSDSCRRVSETPILWSRPCHPADLLVVATNRSAVFLWADRPLTVEQQFGVRAGVHGVFGDGPGQALPAGQAAVGDKQRHACASQMVHLVSTEIEDVHSICPFAQSRLRLAACSFGLSGNDEVGRDEGREAQGSAGKSFQRAKRASQKSFPGPQGPGLACSGPPATLGSQKGQAIGRRRARRGRRCWATPEAFPLNRKCSRPAPRGEAGTGRETVGKLSTRSRRG